MANTQPNKTESTKPDQLVPPRTVVCVINNREGMEIVQMPHRGSDLHKNIIMGEQVHLLPGLNLVDTATFTTLKKNKGFADRFETLIPKSNVPEQNPEKAGKPILTEGDVLPFEKPLSAVRPEVAVALVGEANLIQLEAFKLDEAGLSRPAVMSAILKRIKDLNVNEENTAQDF